MKPPGGDCHDLFGASFSGTPSHLRVLKPPGGASSDIFGPSGSEQTTPEPRRNRAQQSSSLFFGDDDHSATNNKASNKPDGNPVTGEGYEKAVAAKPPSPSQLTNGNSIGSSASSQSGSAAPNNTNSGPIPSRQRVPPGGFSSGLW